MEEESEREIESERDREDSQRGRERRRGSTAQHRGCLPLLADPCHPGGSVLSWQGF